MQSKHLWALTSILDLKSLGEQSTNFEFFRSSETETNLSFLYRFDAVIAAAVHSFKLAVDEIEAQDFDKNGKKLRGVTELPNVLRKKSKPAWLARLSLESSSHIKELSLIGATNLFNSYYKIFKEQSARQRANLETVLSVEFTVDWRKPFK